MLANMDSKNKGVAQGQQAAKSRELVRNCLRVMLEEPEAPSPLKTERESLPFESAGKGKTAATEDKLVCLINTQEPHLKRAVERRGDFWAELKTRHLGTSLFDVKFEFQDQQSDYAGLKPCQMFNHFQGNTELTTKSGLAKNLYLNSNPQMKTDSWFPRCYDLSQASQTEELLDEFKCTAV